VRYFDKQKKEVPLQMNKQALYFNCDSAVREDGRFITDFFCKSNKNRSFVELIIDNQQPT